VKPQMVEALTKRGRTWGEQNAGILRAVRLGKAPSRYFNPFVGRIGSPCSGQYITRIPRAL
jgi:hypothetical protein